MSTLDFRNFHDFWAVAGPQSIISDTFGAQLRKIKSRAPVGVGPSLRALLFLAAHHSLDTVWKHVREHESWVVVLDASRAAENNVAQVVPYCYTNTVLNLGISWPASQNVISAFVIIVPSAGGADAFTCAACSTCFRDCLCHSQNRFRYRFRFGETRNSTSRSNQFL